MVINNVNNKGVKFVSYTGKYPNLCSGILTLEIDGKEYKFGGYNNNCLPAFWSSGGSCGFTNGYENSYINTGEWNVDVAYLPKELKEYANEIDEVFNNNVNYGCCGGCL